MTTPEAIEILKTNAAFLDPSDPIRQAIDHAIGVMKEEGKSMAEHIAELSNEDRMDLFSHYLNTNP